MIPLYAAEERRVEVVEEAGRWEKAGLVSGEQAAAVRERYRPGVVRVNFFLRLLLAGFTLVAGVALPAVPGLLAGLEEVGFPLLLLALAPVYAWAADRHLIQGRRLYRCGAEEALLALAVGFAALAAGVLFDQLTPVPDEWSGLLALGLVLAGTTAAAVRYGYALAALAAVWALAWLPFVAGWALGWRGQGAPRSAVFLLLGAVALWSHARLGRGREGLPRGHVWCLETARLAALGGLYLNVNFYAHRVLWPAIVHAVPGGRSPWSDVACGVLTAVLPLAALALGLARRERALLWFGGLSAVASILTLKYFVHLGYVAEEVTLAGLLVGGCAFGLLRWLRSGPDARRGSFTAEPLLEPRLYGLDAEALAALQPLAPGVRHPGGDGFQPGGGGFGGGGASAGY